jgi:hypothetical protein
VQTQNGFECIIPKMAPPEATKTYEEMKWGAVTNEEVHTAWQHMHESSRRRRKSNTAVAGLTITETCQLHTANTRDRQGKLPVSPDEQACRSVKPAKVA